MGACASGQAADGDAETPSRDLRAVEPEYKLLRLLGQGGDAVVWLAKEAASGQEFALKFVSCKRGDASLTERKAARFVNEVQIAVEMGNSHTNIIPPHELILTRTHICLVSERAPSPTRCCDQDSLCSPPASRPSQRKARPAPAVWRSGTATRARCRLFVTAA